MAKEKDLKCAFCYQNEIHGAVKKTWSQEWKMYIPVCEKHTWEKD